MFDSPHRHQILRSKAVEISEVIMDESRSCRLRLQTSSGTRRVALSRPGSVATGKSGGFGIPWRSERYCRGAVEDAGPYQNINALNVPNVTADVNVAVLPINTKQ